MTRFLDHFAGLPPVDQAVAAGLAIFTAWAAVVSLRTPPKEH